MTKPLSKNLIETVQKVHKEVKELFVWTSDEEVWKSPEKWTRPVLDRDWFNRPILRGDCDDFMLEVYYRLRQQHNFPKSYLRLCVVATESHISDYDHAVLAIEFDNLGETDYLISDCNHDTVVSISKLRRAGYRNFSMSQVNKPITEPWEQINE